MWFENFFLAVRLLFHPRVKLLYKVLLGAGIVIYFLWPWDFISDIPVNLGWVCIWPLTYLDDFLIAYLLMILFINVCPAPIVAQMRAELLHKDPEIMTGLAFQHPGETRTLLWIMLALPITFSVIGGLTSLLFPMVRDLIFSMVDFLILIILILGFKNLKRDSDRRLAQLGKQKDDDAQARRLLKIVLARLKPWMTFPGAEIRVLLDQQDGVSVSQILGKNPFYLTVNGGLHFSPTELTNDNPLYVFSISHEIGHLSHLRLNHQFSIGDSQRWPVKWLGVVFTPWRFFIELTADRVMYLASGQNIPAIAGYFATIQGNVQADDLLAQAARLEEHIPAREIWSGTHPSTPRRIQQLQTWEAELQAVRKK